MNTQEEFNECLDRVTITIAKFKSIMIMNDTLSLYNALIVIADHLFDHARSDSAVNYRNCIISSVDDTITIADAIQIVIDTYNKLFYTKYDYHYSNVRILGHIDLDAHTVTTVLQIPIAEIPGLPKRAIRAFMHHNSKLDITLHKRAAYIKAGHIVSNHGYYCMRPINCFDDLLYVKIKHFKRMRYLGAKTLQEIIECITTNGYTVGCKCQT